MSEGIRRITDVAVYALGHIAEAKHYGKSWGDEFVAKQAREHYDKSIEHLKDFDFKILTLDELKMVGFRMWDEGLLLCPLWVAPILMPNAKDNDTRFGCLAYGWPVVDGKVVWDKKETIA